MIDNRRFGRSSLLGEEAEIVVGLLDQEKHEQNDETGADQADQERYDSDDSNFLSPHSYTGPE
jgi:hypothetical protein